jgi:hypothetical protein
MIDKTGRARRTLAGVEAIQRPIASLYEGWQDQVGGIDLNVFAVTDPAGGAWAPAISVDGMVEVTCTLNANDLARLYGRQPWDCAPTLWGTNYIARRIIMEWVMRMTNIANLDNTACFWGLASATNVTRASQNIIGFGLNADALETITDNGGAETATTGFGETLTNINKFGIVVEWDACRFYLNETLLVTHTNTLHMPDIAMYPMFYYDTEAGGGSVPEIGIMRVRLEDAR